MVAKFEAVRLEKAKKHIAWRMKFLEELREAKARLQEMIERRKKEEFAATIGRNKNGR